MKRLIAFLLLLPALAIGQVTTNPGVTGVSPNLSTAGVVRILARSAIPFIGLSSCIMSAAGALSACTALPATYANAYCYLPANAAATTIAAGWYFCQMSSGTAGTVYLNTYTSGTPTIPTTLTPVTTGSSFTGVTTEVLGPTFTVPANALGPNGLLRVYLWAHATSSAGTKALIVRYSGDAGTAVFNVPGLTTGVSYFGDAVVHNRGATNQQVYSAEAVSQTAAMAIQTSSANLAVDTTAATTLVFSNTRNTATDNIILENIWVELLADGT